MDSIGGYRLVRRLGCGVRADIHLGHAGGVDPPNDDRVAAIKVFRPVATADSIETEIAALSRSRSPHLLELRDLALAPDGQPCLILPRLGSGSLGRLLARREFISAGEAVTILVPLVEAVAELHRVGVAHGGVNAGSVLFDSRGAPVLARFGAATIVGDLPDTSSDRSLTPAAEEENGWLADDRRSLRALIAAVLDRIDDSAGRTSARDRLERLHPSTLDQPPLHALSLGPGERDEIIGALFDLAPAAAVRFDDFDDGEPARASIPARLTPATPLRSQRASVERGPAVAGSNRRRHGASRSPDRGRLLALRIRALAEKAAGTGIDDSPIGALRARLLRSIGAVRRPVWIVGGVGLLALVVALTVVPSALPAEPRRSVSPTAGGEPSTPASAPPPAAESSPAPPSQAPAGTLGPSSSPDSSSSPAPVSTPNPSRTIGPTGEPPTGVPGAAGEDPTAAAVALIAARRECLEQRSARCLDGVDQKESAAMDADLRLLGSLTARADVPADSSLEGMVPGLVQRLGDSAIVQLHSGANTGGSEEPNPASLLLIRSEAGWRIRDLTFG